MAMPDNIRSRILETVRAEGYTPQKPRQLARALDLIEDDQYSTFRGALRELMDEGRVVIGARGAVVLPSQRVSTNVILGTYRHNRRGFGFVVPTDPGSHEDLFIPPGENGGAITGDIVRAKIVHRGHRDGKAIAEGRVIDLVERKHTRFAGTLARAAGQWMVYPDGNTFTEPIMTPDAAARHIKPGTKVVVEITTFPADRQAAEGVITEVLGEAGEKDVDLRGVIVQFNLPAEFPEEVRDQASRAVQNFDPESERGRRLDLTSDVICTIDPDDAKDYDDAISLRRTHEGLWELGVHIADVSHFVQEGTPLDLEAAERGNSTYFPGHVIPMLPEVLSNGVCSLQEGVPRLCKSAFIWLDDRGKPVGTAFANSVIKSRKRLRYREAQALIDNAPEIPHPQGNKTRDDYAPEILSLLKDMDTLAKIIQRRRHAAGQLVLDLPRIELVLNEEGKVVDAVPEDTSFTHTLIEMFMVEANEAVARLLHALGVPFLRRAHPDPDMEQSERLRHFVQVAGHTLPKTIDRPALQGLLKQVRGKPESFAINLAVLKSLTRAEYSPQEVGHFALASQHYCHFTSPIRRYADLHIHRLLDAWFDAIHASFKHGPVPYPKAGQRPRLQDVPSHDDLVGMGKRISFTERRSEDAEKELRQIKVLTLLEQHVGEDYLGVITGITNFGLFVQLHTWLVDGLIRYEDLWDDWWDVDEKAGVVRGQRSGQKLGIGDVLRVRIAKVDIPRRELDLSVLELVKKSGHSDPVEGDEGKPKHKQGGKKGKFQPGQKAGQRTGGNAKHKHGRRQGGSGGGGGGRSGGSSRNQRPGGSGPKRGGRGKRRR
jgi:ribonuclease R